MGAWAGRGAGRVNRAASTVQGECHGGVLPRRRGGWNVGTSGTNERHGRLSGRLDALWPYGFTPAGLRLTRARMREPRPGQGVRRVHVPDTHAYSLLCRCDLCETVVSAHTLTLTQARTSQHCGNTPATHTIQTLTLNSSIAVFWLARSLHSRGYPQLRSQRESHNQGSCLSVLQGLGKLSNPNRDRNRPPTISRQSHPNARSGGRLGVGSTNPASPPHIGRSKAQTPPFHPSSVRGEK